MENAVWIIFGIIALFLGIGILMQIVAGSSDNDKIKTNENSLGKLGQWCDYVCNSDTGTKLTKEIEFSSGTVISARKKSICMDFKDWHNCYQCACDVNAFELNLNREEILQMYSTHVFKCSFEKAPKGVVVIGCKG
ncbi:hypothetical protein J7L85_01355 [candidate division WOR-3 bacterium]|nr:hypothetical protein [candidate division WOR-3 bacterium]